MPRRPWATISGFRLLLTAVGSDVGQVGQVARLVGQVGRLPGCQVARLPGCQVARSSQVAAHCCCWPTKEGAGVRKEDWFLINLDWKMLANDIIEDI